MWCIGGAERLIVDAAVELASHGHKVHMFTAHHDKNRCFEETLSSENWFMFYLPKEKKKNQCFSLLFHQEFLSHFVSLN